MPGNELREQLQAIPGVASAKVTFTDDDAPVARIWLDGSRDAEEVRERVNALLGRSIPRPAPDEAPPRPKRRSGLGRGLPELITADEATPSHIDVRPSGAPVRGLRSVGVVESDGGVAVQIEDDSGAMRSEPIGPDGSIDRAVVEAMANLFGLPDDIEVEIGDVDGVDGAVVVATLSNDSGGRVAGAAFVDFGRPWAVARAIAQAIASS